MQPAVGHGMVDVVIPAYNESGAALAATIDAILRQTRGVNRITVVDDCSREPIALDVGRDPRIRLIRLAQNSGIAAARNAGAADSTAEHLAFVNVDVLPREDWVDTCCAYLERHETVGVVGARTRLQQEVSVLGRWRRLVQERPYPEASGPVRWLAGHAMMFRTAAFRAVGGFDHRMQRAGEDVDICRRLLDAGWEVHFVKQTEARSIQADSVSAFANAEYNRFCWRSAAGNGFFRCAGILSGRFLNRVLLHVLRRQWRFLPVEVAVWFQGMRIAWRKR